MTRIIYTNTKSPKAKKKPGWQQREAEYNAWLKSIGADISTTRRKKQYEPLVLENKTYQRETPRYASLNPHDTALATKRSDTPSYSGDYIVGIATMHKSNLVAVGAGDSPSDYSKMRRN